MFFARCNLWAHISSGDNLCQSLPPHLLTQSALYPMKNGVNSFVQQTRGSVQRFECWMLFKYQRTRLLLNHLSQLNVMLQEFFCYFEMASENG